MYFHVLEKTMRNGVKGYLHIKCYKRYSTLEKFLAKTGAAVWVVESELDYLPHVPYTKDADKPTLYGGFTASYWNTGGWGSTTMPKMPLLSHRN